MKLAHRAADLEDRPGNTERHFILDAWASQLQYLHGAGFVSMRTWFAVMLPELAGVLARPGVKALVAYDADDDGRIADLFGFAVAEPDSDPPLVYFVYVKDEYRRHGFARRMLAALRVDPAKRLDYALRTPVMGDLSRKMPLARWTPIGARYDRDHRRRSPR